MTTKTKPKIGARKAVCGPLGAQKSSVAQEQLNFLT
jgi:hypothetical protein